MKDAASAAAHERSVLHLARRFGTDAHQLGALLEAADEGYGGLERLPSDPRAQELVLEPFGVVQLWDAGISPRRIAEIHQQLWADQGPIPARLYLSFGTYLDVGEWSPWHRFGLPILDIERLLGTDIAPEDVETVALSTCTTPRQVGAVLASWVRAGCTLTPAELHGLLTLPHRHWPAPARQAIDRVHSEAGLLVATRSQAGLVLAVAGTPTYAVQAMRQGARGTRDTYTYMATRGLM